VQIQVSSNHGSLGWDEATKGKTNFTCVYIWKNIFEIFFSRTTGPEKLKFTWKLSDIVQNQVYEKYGPRWWGRAIKGETGFTCVYIKIFFSRTTEPEKLKFISQLFNIVQKQVCKSHGLQGSGGVAIGETVFTYVYMGKII
jgi:hypothetical protein